MRAQRLTPLLLLWHAACAAPQDQCAKEPAPPPASAPTPAALAIPEAQAAPPATIEFDAIAVVGAAELMSKKIHVPVTVDLVALPRATCVKVAFRIDGAFGPPEALDALGAVLVGSGLRLADDAGRHHITLEEGQDDAGCSIAPKTWVKWVGPGIERIDDRTMEIARSSWLLLTTHFVQFGAAGGDPPAGTNGIRLEDWGVFDVFAVLGAKPGDVVTSIQGERIDWSTRWGVLMRKLRDAERALVAIERDGKPMTLTYVVVP